MKIVLSIFLLLACPLVEASQNCRVTEVVNSDIFEESLSVDEYPDVIVDLETVTIGASRYSMESGDVINFKPSIGFRRTVEILPAEGDMQININWNDLPTNKLGYIFVTRGHQKPELIADLVCQ